MAQCDANALIAQACASGFTCRNEPELLALLNQLLCNFASGFLANQFLTKGTTDPVLTTPPATNPSVDQLYVNTANGRLWFWNATIQAWQVRWTGTVTI